MCVCVIGFINTSTIVNHTNDSPWKYLPVHSTKKNWGEGAKTLTCKIVSRSPMWQPMDGKGLAQYRRKGDGDAWREGQGRADYSRPRARAGQSHHHGQGGRRCAGALING